MSSTTSDMQVRSIKVDGYAKLSSDKKQYYRDDDIYTHSPSDGVLNIVADGEVQINGASTYTKYIHLIAAARGLPNTNPPTIVQQDNVELLKFTLNTDNLYFGWDTPTDYAGGNLVIIVEWTNDGGVDDNTKTVKAQLGYQTFATGESVAGSHANSPKTIQDTYASASGWIMHETDAMTIAAADFSTAHGITMKLSFITPTGTALTSEPHLYGIGLYYTAYKNPA